MRASSPQNYTAFFFPIYRIVHQSRFADCSEVVALTVFVVIQILNDFQRLAELEQCSEFMLAVIGAEAVAGDIANPSVAVIEAHLIKPAALDDRPAGCSVNADVHHLVVVVVIKAPFCDLGFDFEISEFIKEESLVETSRGLFRRKSRSCQRQSNESRRKTARP